MDNNQLFSTPITASKFTDAPLSNIIILLASITATLIIYLIFFTFSNKIWATYALIDPALLAPHVRSWIEHDGIEAYVLYFLVMFSFAVTFILLWFYSYSYQLKIGATRWLNYCIKILFLLCAFTFISLIGFHPPMAEIAYGKNMWFIEIFMLLCLWSILKISYLSLSRTIIILLLALLPICFVATSSISMFDYGFIFSPAGRLLHGFSLSDIYFQYDLLLSFLAAAWMKLHLHLEDFRIMGQLSIYMLIIVEFLYARDLFISKKLSYYLLLSLILTKVYIIFIDPTQLFQLTPLRLDWWIVLVLIVMKRGIYSIFLGMALATLLVIHRNFGFLYTLSYFELLGILFFADILENKRQKSFFKKAILKQAYYILPNFTIIGITFIINAYIFKNSTPESALLYQKLGIGFMQITKISFYWYIPILFTASLTLLLQQRKKLTELYFHSGIFLILLGIANSVYFFGRSHESNIIHISASILLILFLLLDLMLNNISSIAQNRWKQIEKRILSLLPIFFIILLTYYYSERISRNILIQGQNIYSKKIKYPHVKCNIRDLKKMTFYSDKIYFLSKIDALYYYQGKYVPQGYYLPYATWPYKKNLIAFLQNLLNKKYYLVIPKNEITAEKEVITALLYTHSNEDDEFKVLWK